MHAILRTIGIVLPIFALAACNSGGSSKGVGADLYTSALPQATQLQDQYVAAICSQAGGTVVQLPDSVDCSAPDGWAAFVQAGMNDIDARCDAYLVWLDQRKRSAKPLLKELADAQRATTAILDITSPGTRAIGILAQAFGFAADTFTNVNSGLLLEVDHSTVQAVVLGRQSAFRNTILGSPVSNRPAAIYALRSYLRICMPITIATDINTTLTALERTDQRPDALIDADTVARTMIDTPSSPVIFRPGAAGTSPGPAGYASTLPPPYVRGLQASLCVSRTGVADAATKDAVQLYLTTKRANPATWTKANEPLLSAVIADVPECTALGLANAYEVAIFAVPKAEREARVRIFQQQLQKYFSVKEPTWPVAETGQFDQQTRDAIAEARRLTGIGADRPLEQRAQLDPKLRTAVLLVSQGNN